MKNRKLENSIQFSKIVFSVCFVLSLAGLLVSPVVTPAFKDYIRSDPAVVGECQQFFPLNAHLAEAPTHEEDSVFM